MSIAFNVNENLSISYGSLTEVYDTQGVASIADVDLGLTLPFVYTMGSMSINFNDDNRLR